MNWYEDPNILVPAAAMFGTVLFFVAMGAVGSFDGLFQKNDK
jgi:hypothetical protein